MIHHRVGMSCVFKGARPGRLRTVWILATGDPETSCAAEWLVAAGLMAWDPDMGLILGSGTT